MHIVLDARTATPAHGIGRATAELAAALPDRLPNGWRVTPLTLAATGGPSFAGAVECSARPYSLREQFEIPRRVAALTGDLYHLPTFWGPFRSRRPFVVMIHDLIHWLFYGPTHAKYRLAYRWGVGPLARKASLVVTGSRASAQSITAVLGIPEERVRIVPYGGDHIQREPAVAPRGIDLEPRSFCFAMGNPRRHKNLAAAVTAYHRFRDDSAAPPLAMVLVGAGHDMEDRDRGVLVASGLGDGELRWIRENAAFGVFPSLMEGFDLPLLEAIGSGCPAIASDIPPHREILGDEYPVMAPEDTEAMAQGMLEVASNDARGEELRTLGLERAARFTWAGYADGMVDVWREVLERDRR